MFYIRVIGNIGAISGLSGITMFLKNHFLCNFNKFDNLYFFCYILLVFFHAHAHVSYYLNIGLYNIPFLAFKYYICPFLMLFFSKPKAQEITRFPPDPFCPSLP